MISKGSAGHNERVHKRFASSEPPNIRPTSLSAGTGFSIVGDAPQLGRRNGLGGRADLNAVSINQQRVFAPKRYM